MSKTFVFGAAAALVVLAVGGCAAWNSTHREVAQPAWITASPRERFLYGSIGDEGAVGIPYWIWLVLPRVFPQYLPGPGGYSSLGVAWEETREMPVGFAKQTVGYVRVAANCAFCHASSRSQGRDRAAIVLPVGAAHTGEIDRVLAFYEHCAQDPSFNADVLLAEIDFATSLSWFERLLYRYVLIPGTKEAFLRQTDVLIDPELLRHAQNPHADSPSFRKRIESLRDGLIGEERGELEAYLARR
jgi:hypothetical protein